MSAPKVILVVEDEEAMRFSLQTVLEEAGYSVRTAADGAEGLNAVQNDHPDLVLLDVILPQMNGLDVLSHVKRDDRTKDIPVVILSSVDRPEDVDRARSLGASDYLMKSNVSLEDVKKKIAALLHSS